MKLWSGRAGGQIAGDAELLNNSIAFDSRMWREDVEGSIAHATMLGECGIIPAADSAACVAGLRAICADIASGALQIDPGAEDIHTFVEQELTARAGDAGRRLHTARSRNDQVALDIRLYLRKQCDVLTGQLCGFMQILCNCAKVHKDTLMPGYTHMQRAQPVTYAHYLMAYAQMFSRDAQRITECRRRINVMPLGSGALAGTSFNIDRERVRGLLGFDSVTQNSMDAVSDRDFILELAFDLSLIMTHLSRMAEEFVMFSAEEFGFLCINDAYSTGSSIMPQKKNPDVAELVRGKTGRVNGALLTLLTVVKGLPLAYNKDLQEDKEAVFDSLDTVQLALRAVSGMQASVKADAARMAAVADGGFLNATDCADYLTARGMPFRDAYKLVGELVRYCVGRGCTLQSLPMDEYKRRSELFGDDIAAFLEPRACMERRAVPGGPAPARVAEQIEYMEELLHKYTSELSEL